MRLSDTLQHASRYMARLKNAVQPGALVLGYHRIAELDNDPWSMAVSPDNFARHLEILRSAWKPMPLPALVEAHRHGNVPHRAVVLTFDDGYADNLTTALPLLERYEIPATVFVATGQIDADHEFWWDELERALLLPRKLPEVLQLDIDGRPQTRKLDGAVEYSNAQRRRDKGARPWQADPQTRLGFYYSVWERLRRVDPTRRRVLLEEIVRWASADPEARPEYRTLRSAELQELSRNPLITIGAHTVSHAFLPEHSPGEQHEEIAGSKHTLERLLAAPVTSFAYPHGEYANDTPEIVQALGFDVACTLGERAVRTISDRFRLPRCGVENWNGDPFTRRLRSWLRR